MDDLKDIFDEDLTKQTLDVFEKHNWQKFIVWDSLANSGATLPQPLT